MSKLQGHEFATSDDLRIAYGHSLRVVGQYALPYNDKSMGTAFTEAGLRQIANKHVEALKLEKLLSLMFNFEDASISYEWQNNGPKTEFLGQRISLTPPGKEDEEWRQHRSRQRSPLLQQTDPDERVRATIFNQRLEHQLGADRILRYEAAALQGIMTAITSATPQRVADMMCSPDNFDY